MLVDVIPVSDPNSSTMAQRVVQYQAVLQMSQQAPQIYNLPVLHREMMEVLGIKNADKIVPTKADAKPTDPVSENMDALIGKPMRAFIYQDHQAHIATHMSFMQDPMIAQMIGQNPQAQQIMASLQAHIAEHLGFQYRQQIEEKLGAPLPDPNSELPQEVEVHLSRLVADAGASLRRLISSSKRSSKRSNSSRTPCSSSSRLNCKSSRLKYSARQQKIRSMRRSDSSSCSCRPPKLPPTLCSRQRSSRLTRPS
jgi:hypothetical protein